MTIPKGVPEGRCGFVLAPEDLKIDFDESFTYNDSDDWHRKSSAVCCWRESWRMSDRGKCVFHVNVEGKEDANLPEMPLPPERFDGAFFRSAALSHIDLSGRFLQAVNFSDANLRGANLSDTFLRFADLSGASLGDANLSGAYLEGANFSDAHLGDANLSGAYLNGANFSGAYLGDVNLSGEWLEEANFSGAGLPGANLSDTLLTGADLSEAHLEDADLSEAHLEDADLSEAYLEDADFSEASLEGVNLRGVNAGRGIVNFSDAHLRGANLSDADLKDSNLSGTYLEDTDFSRADLWGVDLTGANAGIGIVNFSDATLNDANFSDATLSDANLSDATLGGADLSGAEFARSDMTDSDLWNANLSNVDLRSTDLSGANLTDADLSDADLRGTNLSSVSLVGANFSGATLEGVNLSGRHLGGQNFSGADLSGADLSEADLRSADLTRAGLLKADLSSADLSVATLTDADLLGANLSNATLVQATLSDATLGATGGIEVKIKNWYWYMKRRLEIVAWLLDLSAIERRPDDSPRPTNDTPAGSLTEGLKPSDPADEPPSRTNLTGADLRRADLSRADLSYTDLSRADVRKAIMTETVLTEARFDRTDFRFTDLSGESFRDVDFSGVNLEGVDFSKADLVDSTFTGADLRGAVFDNAECRRCIFDGAELERTSFIGCDLRAAKFAGANIYLANFSECQLDPDTTIQAVNTYIDPPTTVRERLEEYIRKNYKGDRALRSSSDQREHRFSVDDPSESGPSVERSVSAHDGRKKEGGDFDRKSTTGADVKDSRSSPGEPDQFAAHVAADPDTEPERVEESSEDASGNYERAAWTYGTIHRLLTRHGRTSEALEERYYRKEQWARIKQAEADRNPLQLVRALLIYLLTLTSERLWSVIMAILVVTTAFTVIYSLPVVGGVTTEAGGTVGPVRLFLFSLVTLFEGTHSIVSEAIPFGIIQELTPLFVVGLEVFGATELEPTTAAGARIVVIERSLGVLLIIPFTLLFIQRLRLYARAAMTEGTGGLMSWLFGK